MSRFATRPADCRGDGDEIHAAVARGSRARRVRTRACSVYVQIATLQRWYAGGMPEKAPPPNYPELPEFPEGWQLGEARPGRENGATLPALCGRPGHLPQSSLPLNLPEDKWVRAIEFRPGNRSIVHHALFYLDSTGAARELDAADAEPGFGEKGRVGRDFAAVGGWAVVAPTCGSCRRTSRTATPKARTWWCKPIHPTGKAEAVVFHHRYFLCRQTAAAVVCRHPVAAGVWRDQRH